MRPVCLFLQHVAICQSSRVTNVLPAPQWRHLAQPLCQRRPYSSKTIPRQPTAMSFSLPRVQRSSSNPDHNEENGHNTSPSSSNSPTPSSPSENSVSSVYDTLSKATIIGRTGGVPEIKQLPSGIKLASFGLATNHIVGSGPSQRVETQWHNVQIFEGVTGFNLISSLQAGTQLYIEGSLRISTYEKDGSTKQYVNIIVNRSLGMFRILRRPYKQGNVDYDTNKNDTPADNFPF